MKKILLAFVSSILLIAPALLPFGSASAQSGASGGQAPADPQDLAWPRKIVSGQITILFYQPQVEKWEGNQIQAYSAVAVQTAGSQQQTYGVVYFTARTEVDKVNRLVTLNEFNVTKGNFPTASDKTSQYVGILQQAGKNKVEMVALDHLLSDLAVQQQEQKGGYQLDNEPPRVIFSTKPAVLVLIDGEPVLRPSGQNDLDRVINTRALILFERKKNKYYLALLGGWVEGASPEGPWTFAKDVPGDVEKAKDKIAGSGQVDLLTGDEAGQAGQTGQSAQNDSSGPSPQPEPAAYKSESLKDRLSDGTFPTIYVSTVPAELLLADGEPQLKPIPGTGLLYVSNSQDQIFVNTANQNYYILISGRWFTGKSMDGPWAYVDGKDLPQDFAKIPEGDPKASVLASTPGTPAAEEARISNQIPQTATIDRSQTRLTVIYDGEPQFKPIEGTSLQYAINTQTPVIEVSSNNFLAVQNGVWFASNSAQGPWSAATSVPPVVYSIPPKSPLHYVTYVSIYGYTPEYVYCGYTPGYYGTVLSDDGLVVYGTGWYYPPYIGSFWYGWPWTYGLGAGFFWSPWGGWSFGLGLGYYFPFWRPWWGPLGFGWGWSRWTPGWGWRGWGGVAGLNVYGRWGRGAMIGTRAAWARGEGVHRDGDGWMHNPRTGAVGGGARGAGGGVARGATGRPGEGGNVFAGRDGNVYRYNEQNRSWEQHNGTTWQKPGGSFDQRSMDQSRQGRSTGQQRAGTFHGFGGFGGGGRGGGFGGGGFGGGGFGGRRR
jgi:hypothetical protein